MIPRINKEPKYYEAKMPNELVRASYQFTEYEHRLFSLALTELDKIASGQTLEIKYPLEVFGKPEQKNWRSSARKLAEQTCERYMSRRINAGTKQDWKYINFVQSAEYYRETDEIEISYTPKFSTFLKKFKSVFTLGDIELMFSFTSRYSFRTYWLIRSQQFKTNSISIDKDEYCQMLEIPESYQVDNRNLKARVLKPIEKDFSGSWVDCTTKVKRKGKGKYDIIFMFKSDIENKKFNEILISENWQNELINRGFENKYLSHVITWVRKKRSFKNKDSKIVPLNGFFVSETIKHCELNKHKVDKPIEKNFPRYIYRAIENGWFKEEIYRSYRHFKEQLEPTLPMHKEKVIFESKESEQEFINSMIESAKLKGQTIHEYAEKTGFAIIDNELYRVSFKNNG